MGRDPNADKNTLTAIGSVTIMVHTWLYHLVFRF